MLLRLVHCQRSEGAPTCSQLYVMRTRILLLFFLFYSLFFPFFLMLTAEKIRRSCYGTNKSEQRKCSACKYLNYTIHHHLFLLLLLFCFFSRDTFFFPSLPSRSKSSRVPQCSTRKCALKLAMQQILMNGLVMTLCITKLAEKSKRKNNIINIKIIEKKSDMYMRMFFSIT